MLTIFFLALFLQVLAATADVEHSKQKIRIHKHFIKETMDQNFAVVLEHIEKHQDKNVFLTEINANIEKLEMKLCPQGNSSLSVDKKWSELKTELFFDNGQIVMEIDGLAYSGAGVITDPASGIQETIELSAVLDLAQIVMSPDQEVSKQGYVYPKIDIAEVSFQLNNDNFMVQAHGDLPLYKSRKFEEGIKNWMISQIEERQKQFREALQKAERQIMSSFAFKKEIWYGSTAHSSLSEVMTLEGDYLVIQFMTDFEGSDLNQIKADKRQIEPQFSTELTHMRDVQQVIDEHYLNYLLFSLFYKKGEYSLTEQIFSVLPDQQAEFSGMALRMIMSTGFFQLLFPELRDKYGVNKRVDLKCSFNKSYLERGHLSEQVISRVFLRDGNIIDIDLHFGCGLYVDSQSQKQESNEGMEMILQLFEVLSKTSQRDFKWETYRSFFISMTAQIEFDFSEDAKKFEPLGAGGLNMNKGVASIFGKIKRFDPKVHEIKVYKDDNETDEADSINKQISNIKSISSNLPEPIQPIYNKLLDQGIPLIPFPNIQRCLGLESKDSSMTIQEGFAILSYDLEVRKSHPDCLFKMNEILEEKEVRWAQLFANKSQGKSEQFMQFSNLFAGRAQQLLSEAPEFPAVTLDMHDLKEIDRYFGSPAENLAQGIIRDIADQNFDKYKNFKFENLKIPGLDTQKIESFFNG